MPWPSCSLSRSQMRVSHLAETDPGHPGMIRRTGKPWIGSSGLPFISHAMRLFSSISFLIGTPRDRALLVVSPDRCGSAP